MPAAVRPLDPDATDPPVDPGQVTDDGVAHDLGPGRLGGALEDVIQDGAPDIEDEPVVPGPHRGLEPVVHRVVELERHTVDQRRAALGQDLVEHAQAAQGVDALHLEHMGRVRVGGEARPLDHTGPQATAGERGRQGRTSTPPADDQHVEVRRQPRSASQFVRQRNGALEGR